MDRYIMQKCNLLLLIVVLLLVAVPGGTAHAQTTAETIIVNTTDDAPDADLGDSACDADPGPAVKCTLRAAITQANLNPGLQRILLEPKVYRLTVRGNEEYVGASGDLNITQNLIIELAADVSGSPAKSARATIDASGLGDRVLMVFQPNSTASVVVSLRSLQIIGGDLSAISPENDDPIVDAGGGVFLANNSRLVLDSVTIARNKARNGGGIFVSGGARFDLNNSQISDNQAIERGPNNAGHGGGMFISSSSNANALVRLTNTTITRNTASSDGGGIYNTGSLSIGNSQLADNSAGRSGGGLFHEETKTVKIENTTIARNSAVFRGGGIRWNDGALRLTNVTISANRANFGGGLLREKGKEAAPALAFFQNVTIAGNIGRGIATDMPNSNIAMENSIVANNASSNCSRTLLDDRQNSFNLITDGSCTVTKEDNLLNVNALLGPLQFNGGPTPTHGLRPGSPAINGGQTGGCPHTDQRGVQRRVFVANSGDPCDLGAFEVNEGSVGTFALNPAALSTTTNQTTTLALTWTHPNRWRDLDTVDLQLRSGEFTPLRIRFTEGITSTDGVTLTNGLALYNSDGTLAGVGEAGSTGVIESDMVLLDLAQSQVEGSGPDGKTVTLTLAVRLKEPAAGNVYAVMLLASDDTGALQGPNEAGTLAVGPFKTFLPVVN